MTLPPPITSRTNARVKALRAAFSGKASEPGELVGIEGVRVMEEAIRSKTQFDCVFLREGSEEALDQKALEGLKPKHWAVLTREIFDDAVSTQTPQGIAATVQIPMLLKMNNSSDAGGLTLMLEDIQDPGNLGTLIRSAEAFGFDQIFISAGTVNPWNPKVVRASAGCVLRMPVVRTDIPEQAKFFQSLGARIVAAVAAPDGASAAMSARMIAPCTLLVGNEGSGLSQAAREAADELVRIPCFVESLNAAVAGSILMYEALRQNVVSELKKRDPAERVM